MTTRPQDLQDEADHWLDYQRQQAEAARRCGVWDHASEQSPLAAARDIAAGLVYAIAAVCTVIVILGFGFLS